MLKALLALSLLLLSSSASAQLVPELQLGVIGGGGWYDVTGPAEPTLNRRMEPTIGGTARVGFAVPGEVSLVFAVNGDLLSMADTTDRLLVVDAARLFGLRFQIDPLASFMVDGFYGVADTSTPSWPYGRTFGAGAEIKYGAMFVGGRYQVFAFDRVDSSLWVRQALCSIGFAR